MVSKNKTLVYSIAMNGYQHLYAKNLASHRQYARRYNHEYVVIQKPYCWRVGRECAWLKLTVLLYALEQGYSTILYVDADAEIKKEAPNFVDILVDEKDFYIAKGYTDRLNSGVFIVRNSVNVIDWVQSVIESRHKPVRQECSVGWGENGHIIQYAKDKKFVKIIDPRWNNNANPMLKDYIRHYSFGPMRCHYKVTWLGYCLWRLNQVPLVLLRQLRWDTWLKSKSGDLLTDLTKTVIQRYLKSLSINM
ncbi:hypothetical protein [Marinibactrum halimedae]|uniref:Nucleotide-diphospho-sugar transferase domain-containing protein n=1 Tax=Marinibactrum halimedae TaxID=1444977 RepID=A0AA37WNA8_9GAMM|nr:hypothetical protein [Marinibactrum halimedae]MCD9457839.1 hypothetical protein [Marinibactrum halimedae]GLS24787.1 hypothetical protein GCM10007877_05010 [Marinibactrum halimedae]